MAAQTILKLATEGNLESFTRSCAEFDSADELLNIRHKKSGDTPFLVAARHGHLSLLKYMIENDVDSMQTNFDGKNALHEAAQGGRTDCAEYLLDHGIPIDSLKRADWTPLMLACTKLNLDVVELFLRQGASLKLKNKDGWTHLASREGSCSILQSLMKQDGEAWNCKSKNGRTPLHTAALHGRSDAITFLLNYGSYDCGERDSCGNTALMDAVKGQHIDAASILIKKHSAHLEAVDSTGKQCIHIAAHVGSCVMVKFLVEKHDADINRPTCSGTTSLHLAAKEGHLEALKLLLSLGADINLKDGRGRTALHIACGSQHAGCADALLCHGAENVPDDNGRKPSDLAVKETVKQLF